MTADRGVLYAAFGEAYVIQANSAAASVKRFCPELPVALFTNLPDLVDRTAVDDIHEAPHTAPAGRRTLDRLLALGNTPFDQTLALDTDTLVLDDIRDIFKVLSRFDLALCHAHKRAKKHARGLRVGNLPPSLPYAFCEMQMGVLAYNRSPQVLSFLDGMLRRYREVFGSDQAALREALWLNRDIRFYVLPREYNFTSIEEIKRWHSEGYKRARPKIFHYARGTQDPARLWELMESYLEPVQPNRAREPSTRRFVKRLFTQALRKLRRTKQS